LKTNEEQIEDELAAVENSISFSEAPSGWQRGKVKIESA